MSHYIIGVGGTGAKFVESFVHLSAAGLIPPGTDISLFFVDPDASNGTLDRAQETVNLYASIRGSSKQDGSVEPGIGLPQQSQLFSAFLNPCRPLVWSPLENNNETLKGFFRTATLRGRDPKLAKLVDVLYTEEEKETRLDQGFLGHPSIGAAFMADRIGQNEPWKSMFSDLDGAADEPRVFLAGSIFGGTGASGIPTIVKRLNAQIKQNKLHFGTALVLPYFDFSNSGNTGGDSDARKEQRILRAKSEYFLVSTRAALQYYETQLNDDTFSVDRLYLIGDQQRSAGVCPTESKGGATQSNRMHYVDLFASIAATDFIKIKFGDGNKKSEKRVASREEESVLCWDDIPVTPGEESGLVRLKIGSLVRFSYAYISVYYPVLSAIRDGKMKPYQAPWYLRFFLRQGSSIAENLEAADNLKKYCENMIIWASEIQSSAPDSLSIEFFDKNALMEVQQHNSSDFRVSNAFADLIRGGVSGENANLGRVWEQMCAETPDRKLRPMAGFTSALYKCCQLV